MENREADYNINRRFSYRRHFSIALDEYYFLVLRMIVCCVFNSLNRMINTYNKFAKLTNPRSVTSATAASDLDPQHSCCSRTRASTSVRLVFLPLADPPYRYFRLTAVRCVSDIGPVVRASRPTTPCSPRRAVSGGTI